MVPLEAYRAAKERWLSRMHVADAGRAALRQDPGSPLIFSAVLRALDDAREVEPVAVRAMRQAFDNLRVASPLTIVCTEADFSPPQSGETTESWVEERLARVPLGDRSAAALMLQHVLEYTGEDRLLSAGWLLVTFREAFAPR